MKTGAELLCEARIGRRRLDEIPEPVRPKNELEAYDCQDRVVEGLLAHYGGEVIGYKIACTNAIAQQQLQVDGPFFGRLLSPFCFDSPAKVAADGFVARVIEAEFGFRMGRDLELSAQAPSREAIIDAVDAVIPAIEIVDSRFESWTTIGAPSLIADNACNAAWVRGPLFTNWRSMDLAKQSTRLLVNGKVVREGSGAAVLGDPLNALEWLVNKLTSRGLGLKAGQFITTGVTTEVYMAERGDHIVADFGPVGTADLVFL